VLESGAVLARRPSTAVFRAVASGSSTDIKRRKIDMLKIASIIACGVAGTIVSFDAQAFPYSPATVQMVAPEVMQVRGFCGLGRHRGPYGGCVLNGVPYGYVAPVVVGPYAPAVVVAPPVVCPYGYYFYAPYGRCVPTP